jgi:hypothetical protein
MNTTTTQRDSNHIPMDHSNIHLSRNKHTSPTVNEHNSKSTTTPFFNVHLFDDSDEFQSEDNADENIKQRRGTNSSKQTHDDEDGDHESLHNARSRSHSLDDSSVKSSSAMRPRADTTRNVLTRRRALDPGAAHNLRSYVRHRKDSIVQRVIGYNYDDHSTAGGLYIRVGIGSKTKIIKIILFI